MARKSIEFHPENGDCPWVVVTETGDAMLWSAYGNVINAAARLIASAMHDPPSAAGYPDKVDG